MLPKEILKIVPLFRNLDDDDLRLVSTCLHKESYSKGAVIFRQGDAGDTMYIVESGQVAVIGEEGKEAIAFMGPGSFVGEISLLLARPRSATLQVILDAQLWALSKADFEWLVMSRPSIGLEMMRELSKRLVTTTQRKRFQTRPRRITAVFGLKGLELAHAVYAQLKTPVAVLPLPNAQAAADFPHNRGVMVMGISDLNEASLAERLSYQVEVFKHVVVLLPQQYDDLAEKAVELADTVVSIGRNPAWFTPIGKRGDFWISGGAAIDLDRIARRLVNRTVGLALSSGGSRGLAHLGVLKVLMEENIPIDLVAGTSAGALFGALYALGWSAEQLVAFTGELKAATRLINWDFNFPPRTALVKGKIARDKLIANWVEHKDFDETLTPLYIVAADAYTGEEVIFDSGPLADAIRASLSIPILAEPWHYRRRFLLDGGVVNPLPASVLRERGADIVIGSSVVQPMGQSYRGDTQKMPNILQIVSNIFSTMEAEVIGKQLPLIDVLIQHKVSANHALDFDQAKTLVEIGEQSARQMLPEIKEAMQRVPEG